MDGIPIRTVSEKRNMISGKRDEDRKEMKHLLALSLDCVLFEAKRWNFSLEELASSSRIFVAGGNVCVKFLKQWTQIGAERESDEDEMDCSEIEQSPAAAKKDSQSPATQIGAERVVQQWQDSESDEDEMDHSEAEQSPAAAKKDSQSPAVNDTAPAAAEKDGQLPAVNVTAPAAAEKEGQSPTADDNIMIMEEGGEMDHSEAEQSPAGAEKAGQSPSVDDNSTIIEEPEQSSAAAAAAAAAEKERNANLEGEKSSSSSSSKTKPSGNDVDIFSTSDYNRVYQVADKVYSLFVECEDRNSQSQYESVVLSLYVQALRTHLMTRVFLIPEKVTIT
jgi:hypothetical protein